jgi:erythronate-4-phosphate dehydrogenase
MKIVVDENIIFGQEAFSEFGEVITVPGRSIDNSILRSAEILIVRSVTKVDEPLLKDTKIKFVGTATIGTDHLDLEYLRGKDIQFANAKGCNANAVKEYVLCAIAKIASKYHVNLEGISLGVIGVGNIGSLVAKAGKMLGMKVVKNDPPLQRETNSKVYQDLEEALTCDIITFHVPLNAGGIDNTYHLINESNLRLIKPSSILINSSRGPVIDNKALFNYLLAEGKVHTVLDVWENEPNLDLNLLSRVNLGTAHVAGYSFEGKVNGTAIIHNQLCEHLGVESKWKPLLPKIEDNIISVNSNDELQNIFHKLFNSIYPIDDDDRLLRRMIEMSASVRGKYFDELRKNYRLRREFNNYKVRLNPFNKGLAEKLENFGFMVIK